MSARVLHFTTVHPPRDVRIFVKECRTLAAAGYEVVLVARDAPDAPIDGVTFRSLPAVHGGRLRRVITGNVALLRLLWAERADVYHFHDPELLPVGLALRLGRRRVIYDAHEDVVRDVLSKPYLPRVVRPVLAATIGALEWLVARTASHVIAATPDVARRFPARTTTVVHNFPLREELPSAADDADAYRARPPHGVYTGAMTAMRQAEEMFAAADAVHEKNPSFALVTAGATYGVDPARHPGVRHLGVVAHEDVAAILEMGRFGVTLVRDLPHLATSLPTKFFEYAAAGLPVIVSRSNTTIADIVRDERCGIVVDETDVDDITAAMQDLLSADDVPFEMGQRGARVVRERFLWEGEAPALLETYRVVIGGRP